MPLTSVLYVPNLVKWKVICLSKDKGGLGIRGLLNLNRALLGKWSWRFAIEDSTLWKDIIRLKYGAEKGGWFSHDPERTSGVSLWKEIRKEAAQMRANSDFLVGDSKRVRFWEDAWCGQYPVYHFPGSLFHCQF